MNLNQIRRDAERSKIYDTNGQNSEAAAETRRIRSEIIRKQREFDRAKAVVSNERRESKRRANTGEGGAGTAGNGLPSAPDVANGPMPA